MFNLFKKKKMSKFQVGDTVIGNELATKEYLYTVTYNGYIGKVIKTYNNGHFDIENNDRQSKNTHPTFNVSERAFDLYKNTNMTKQLTGYKLRKLIPGDKKSTIGEVVKTTEKQDYYELLPDYWEPIYEEKVFQVGEFKADFRTNGFVKFGCQHFTKGELLAIKRLFHKEIDAQVTIGGVKITVEIMDYLISNIK